MFYSNPAVFTDENTGGDFMRVVIRTNDRKVYYVKTPALASAAQALYNSITEKFADVKYRAISVELDTDSHSERAVTIVCNDITRISME